MVTACDMRTCGFVTSEGQPGARFERALATGELVAAEQAAFEIAFILLADAARALVELYAENGDPKFERAALKYLACYLAEANPSMDDVARVAASLPSATCSCAVADHRRFLPLPTPVAQCAPLCSGIRFRPVPSMFIVSR